MIGQRLGPYLVLEKIGAGGMGVVYRARDERLNREVALKVLPPEALADESARNRLLHEARTASALNHPHICTIFDIGEVNDQFYVAMELVKGRPLSALITSEGLPVESVAHYGAQIADALSHAHGNDVTHRDLKSANVMITPEGRAKILDFGLAIRGQAQLAAVTQSKVSLSEAGGAGGTLPYMAPEVLSGTPADARSDLWSLGVTLHEMASGRLPFRGRTGFELTSAILRDPPAPLPEHVPMGLRAVIGRCLSKEPGQRYQRASEVRAALEAIRSVPTMAPAARGPVARRWLLGLAGAALAVMLSVVAGLNVGGVRERLLGRAASPHIESLVVLPLANLSRDPEQEYFADGMTEALISDLAKIDALRVISRTSAMHYKDTQKTLSEIARELRVDAVVEGSVARSGSRVRITARLVHAPTEKNLWTGSYERDLRDLFALQSEIAQAITREIKIKLTPEQQVRLAGAHPVNPEAQEAYLKGRHHWNKRTIEELNKGVAYFRQAIQKDPGYAPAYAGLADSYNFLGTIGVNALPPKEAFSTAKEAALKALEIDNGLGEAHTSLAFAKLYYDWDWPEAERRFQRAISLSPGYAHAHQWYSHYLTMVSGRPDEAIAEAKHAQQLDPLSLPVNVNVAWQLYFARRYDEAIEQCGKTLELDSNFFYAHWILGLSYEQKRRFQEAVREFRQAVVVSGDNPAMVAALGHAYAVSGQKDQALEILRKLEHLEKTQYIPAYAIAELHAGLGDGNRAFECLEEAYKERSPYMALLRVNPRLDPLRSYPRFRDLLRRMNFPK